MKKKRLIGVMVAGGVAGTAALAMAAGLAQASAPVPCNAGSKGAGTACVLVDNQDGGDVGSVRVNGRCLQWSSNKETHYYGDVAVAMSSTPTVLTYSGSHCEGNTQTVANVNWSDSAGKRTNFRRVTLTHHDSHSGNCGGCNLCGVSASSHVVIHC